MVVTMVGRSIALSIYMRLARLNPSSLYPRVSEMQSMVIVMMQSKMRAEFAYPVAAGA